MLPVVPKVRVGDVLYATRNLRNWLQTASLMYSVKQHVHNGGSLRGSKGIIYAPKRKDKYVVCVNAGFVFAVFVPGQDLFLFFVNTIGANGRDMEKSKLRYRMSPSLFSTWFVRSNERLPDLRQWPDYSYAAWVSLQMNAVGIKGDYRLAVPIPQRYDSIFCPNMGGLGNFGPGKRSKDRGTLRLCLQHAIKTGMTRENYQTGQFQAAVMGHVFGPRMSDIEKFRKDLGKWIKNPRIRKSLETGLPESDISSIRHAFDNLLQKDD
ncbi:hypothetical protein LCGC14_1263330 [marine sediment metagenome]|uniref:Uncharacterized protein n=1 Tax=marine sediment metagenome TaxID=412755 RepID=A0A0F9LLF1_9ZZZZ